MRLSNATLELLASLDALSNNTLANRGDLGTLIELSVQQGSSSELDELSFLAKFISKAHAIMTRVGRNGEGYERVAQEFSENVEKARGLLNSLLENAPQPARQQFFDAYLALTPESIQRFLSLCNDLSWHKNWLIDHGKRRRP